MTTSLPVFKMLTPEGVKQIDRTGRQILANIGIRIRDGTFLKRLEKAGIRVDHDKQRAYFNEERLDELLSSAPSHFMLYSRDGKNDLRLGRGDVHFANGGRVFRVLDIAHDNYRYTTLKDVALSALLVDQLEYIHFYVIACQAHDVEPSYYHLNDFLCSFNHTTKHVMGGCDSLDGVKQVWKLACYLASGEDKLRKKPFFSIITNPISPLTIEGNTLNVLDFCVTHGIPVTCSPAPIAGATSPATLAGTLAQMHAEALAGVAISQALAPGACVIYGAVPTTMDLRNMDFTMGAVETGMMGAAAVQLARLYNLPVRAAAGVTESKKADIQTGIEKSLSNLMVATAGADCILLAAGILDSGNSISYEQYVIDNEIAGMVYRTLSGISVNKNTLGYETIEQVGPGGNYVMEEHTVEHMVDEFFYPGLSVRCNFDVWQETGQPDMLSRANDVVHAVFNQYEAGRKGLLSPGVLRGIRANFRGIQDI